MAKLYASIENDKGKKEGKGGDKWLEIDLTHGNNPVGRIILDDHGGNDWRLTYQRPGGQSWTVDHCLTPKGMSKGCERHKLQSE